MNQRYAPQYRKMEEKKCYAERYYDDKYEDRHENHNRCKEGDEPGKAILKCSPGASLPNVLVAVGVLTPQTFQLGSVSINTNKLCNPTTLVTVSGEITALIALAISPGNLVLTKSCRGIQPQVVATYSTFGVLGLLAVHPFSYQFCDCNASCCCDCVTYTLSFVSTPALAINLSFNNVVVSALAVEKDCNC